MITLIWKYSRSDQTTTSYFVESLSPYLDFFVTPYGDTILMDPTFPIAGLKPLPPMHGQGAEQCMSEVLWDLGPGTLRSLAPTDVTADKSTPWGPISPSMDTLATQTRNEGREVDGLQLESSYNWPMASGFVQALNTTSLNKYDATHRIPTPSNSSSSNTPLPPHHSNANTTGEGAVPWRSHNMTVTQDAKAGQVDLRAVEGDKDDSKENDKRYVDWNSLGSS